VGRKEFIYGEFYNIWGQKMKWKIPIRKDKVKVRGKVYSKYKINHFPVGTLIKDGLTQGSFKIVMSSEEEENKTLWGWLILEKEKS